MGVECIPARGAPAILLKIHTLFTSIVNYIQRRKCVCGCMFMFMYVKYLRLSVSISVFFVIDGVYMLFYT